ncbi:myosin heavy chain, striated muscle-like [Ictalurus furcatus]|uniref:myosin heavy chain, striated muscle-like n=1 Tax=Ictalurus furcatus TaxID=66913 RepID=UPI00235048AD|nr:myosin heavy chain, striated muscle-like [Ictalurus furcatus]XP_053478373.1 myosin heavy chain, striated muscle-like [Ictalurus furcatus]
MNKFLSALGAGVVDVPVRPLLYTAGAAATAASIYYHVKRGDGKKTSSSDPEVTTEDPVCDQATEPALLQPTVVPQDQLTDAVTEAEEKIQKLVVSNTQLQERVRELEELLCEARRDDMKSKASLTEAVEKQQKAEETLTQLQVEKADLTTQVETQRGKMQDVEKMLSETHRMFDDLMNEYQMKNDEMKKRLIDTEEILKSSMTEAEETLTRLQVEKADLTTQVETLQETVQYLGNLLNETHRCSDDLMNEYQMKNDETEKRLIDAEEILKASLTEVEKKHQKAEETITQLQVEKADLKDHVKTLQGRVQDMGNLLTETDRECDMLMNECECEREAYSNLKSEYEEMKETLMNKEEILKASLTEVEEKHQKAEESITQLQVEKADLTTQVETLQETVQDLETLLSETHIWAAALMNEYQMKNDEMKKRLIDTEEILKASLTEAVEKHQKAEESITQLQVEKADLTTQVETLQETVQDMENLLSETHRMFDDLMNASLTEVMEKHQKAEETLTQLQVEKADLTTQVETLQETVQYLGNLLTETHGCSDDLMNECECEREAYSNLKSEYEEMKETLMNKEEILKASLTEAVEKHQKAEETLTQLQVEKADLTTQVERLRETVQDLGNLFTEAQMECDELRDIFSQKHGVTFRSQEASV